MALFATQLTANPSSVDINGTASITISVAYSIAASRLTGVRVEVAGQTYNIGQINGTSFSWTPPVSLLNALPNSVSATATISGQPADGNGTSWGGRESCYATLNVPANYKPNPPGGVNVTRIDNGVPPAWDIWVAGRSKLSATWSAATATGGATVKEYRVYTSESSGYWVTSGTSIAISTTFLAGDYALRVFAVDSRGRISETSTPVNFTVSDYKNPTITAHRCERASAEGAATTLGKYLKLSAEYQFSTLGGNNSASATFAWRSAGSGSFSSETPLPPQTEVVFGGNFDANTAYEVRLTVTDALGTSTAYIAKVKALSIALEFLSGGDGAAFGKEATSSGELDVAWDLRVRGDLMVSGSMPNIPAGKITSGTISAARLPVLSVTWNNVTEKPSDFYNSTAEIAYIRTQNIDNILTTLWNAANSKGGWDLGSKPWI